ncbi:sugar ABC transporter ATP-binding protein, partial [Mesorhizobium sp. M0633]
KGNGEPLILLSGNMRPVCELVDRSGVFRRGRIVAYLRTQDTDGNEIVSYITGAKTGQAELAA